MMSISTMSMSGSVCRMLDGVAPGLGRDDHHVAPLQDAGQREDVADVVVDDQHLLAGEHLVGLVELLEHPPLGLGQLVDRRVQEEGGLVEQPLGRADLPEGHRRGERLRPGRRSSGRRLVGVEDHRQAWCTARRGAMLLEELVGRSCRAATSRAPGSRPACARGSRAPRWPLGAVGRPGTRRRRSTRAISLAPAGVGADDEQVLDRLADEVADRVEQAGRASRGSGSAWSATPSAP